MEIIYKSVSDLLPYVNNPKKHPDSQIDKLASSIKKFGFRVPLLIEEDGEVIAGHGRILAVQKLEDTLDDLLSSIDSEEEPQRYETLERVNKGEVPCIPATDLTEAQKKAYRIADNKIAESEWDDELLSVEFQELEELDFDLDLTGFDLEEIDFYLEDSNLGEMDIDMPDGDVKEQENVDDHVVVHFDVNIDTWNDREDLQEELQEIVEKFGGKLDVA